MKKKGQITLFVIVAIIIVASTLAYFILRDSVAKIETTIDTKIINPASFLESCLEDDIESKIEILSFQGGQKDNPLSIRFQFIPEQFWNISYLCYTSADYIPCGVQQPSIIKHMENELKIDLSEKVDSCFDELKESLNKEGYEATGLLTDFEIDLIENKIILQMQNDLVTKRFNQTQTHENFRIELNTELYNLAKMAQEVVKFESKYGAYDRVKYALMNPNYEMSLNKLSDGSEIYTIKERRGEGLFRFAIRGNVLPTI